MYEYVYMLKSNVKNDGFCGTMRIFVQFESDSKLKYRARTLLVIK